ncbi:hypothetical protein CMV_028497 [Castanea mollissima]|uniref:Disease resistance N-terminal domain-containing protein n=1 Tax=Castanea mollissima TaxID=60419 RepID=A0A8J4V504_9ROSI|nr:hypothetical protein CMV_028497 [Castanea mollissima]
MAWALVSTIADQLGSLIASEFKDRLGSLLPSEVASIVNVKEEVEKLERKFHEMQAMLNDAEERQVKEEAVRLWLEKLNDVSYEMGDVLDEWNTAKIKADIEKEEEAEASTAKRRKCKETVKKLFDEMMKKSLTKKSSLRTKKRASDLCVSRSLIWSQSEVFHHMEECGSTGKKKKLKIHWLCSISIIYSSNVEL